MVAQTMETTTADQRTAHYLEAERRLWDHYGLAPTERFIDLASPRARVRVQEVGSGEPVLFVPGTGGTGPMWGPLVRELDGYRCILLDRPGWGLSSAIDYSKAPYAQLTAKVLAGVLDALEIASAHVVGASIGNLWAMRFAQHHPERVRSVVLLGGGPLTQEIVPPAFVSLLATPIGALIVRLPQKEDRVRSILRGLGHGPSLDDGRIPDAFVDWRLAFDRDTRSMRHERSMVRTLVQGRAFRPGVALRDDEIAAIAAPTVLIHGTADDVGSTETWQRFTNGLPSGALETVSDAGHLPWLDEPARVGARVRHHVSQHRQEGAPR